MMKSPYILLKKLLKLVYRKENLLKKLLVVTPRGLLNYCSTQQISTKTTLSSMDAEAGQGPSAAKIPNW